MSGVDSQGTASSAVSLVVAGLRRFKDLPSEKPFMDRREKANILFWPNPTTHEILPA
jgi:hypothetical protein